MSWIRGLWLAAAVSSACGGHVEPIRVTPPVAPAATNEAADDAPRPDETFAAPPGCDDRAVASSASNDVDGTSARLWGLACGGVASQSELLAMKSLAMLSRDRDKRRLAIELHRGEGVARPWKNDPRCYGAPVKTALLERTCSGMIGDDGVAGLYEMCEEERDAECSAIARWVLVRLIDSCEEQGDAACSAEARELLADSAHAEAPEALPTGDGVLVAVILGGTCQLTVDGWSQGARSSLRVRVEPGAHVVSCTPPGKATRTHEVRVARDRPGIVSFKLR